MPLGDWQFWAVSLVAMGATVAVLRPVFRAARRRGRREQSADLTVSMARKQATSRQDSGHAPASEPTEASPSAPIDS